MKKKISERNKLKKSKIRWEVMINLEVSIQAALIHQITKIMENISLRKS